VHYGRCLDDILIISRFHESRNQKQRDPKALEAGTQPHRMELILFQYALFVAARKARFGGFP
jgi:hypothetical protein